MKTGKLLFNLIIIFSVILIDSCTNELVSPSLLKGKLTLTLDVDPLAFSVAGRTQTVNTDSFKIIIYNSSGTAVRTFQYYKDIDTEIEIDTGTYYVTAESKDNVSAAFDKPYYFGKSDLIAVKSKVIYPVSINCQLSNFMVTIKYSDYVKNNCDSWFTKVYNDTDTLLFTKEESRSGYFKLSDIHILSKLIYIKSNDVKDTITVTGSIENPEEKTNYIITIDAHIDGFINPISIDVDEMFNSVPLTFTNINLEQGLLAFYPFAGNATDLINGYNGTVVNAISGNGVDGVAPSAYIFPDGAEISIPNIPLQINEDFTISFWINMSSLVCPDLYQSLVCGRHDINTGAEKGGFEMLINPDGTFSANFHHNPLGIIIQINTPDHINVNEWRLISFVKNGTTVSIYIDNINDVNESVAGMDFDDNYMWTFGATQNPGETVRELNGYLDQVRIYQRALTPDEIDYIYQNKI